MNYFASKVARTRKGPAPSQRPPRAPPGHVRGATKDGSSCPHGSERIPRATRARFLQVHRQHRGNERRHRRGRLHEEVDLEVPLFLAAAACSAAFFAASFSSAHCVKHWSVGRSSRSTFSGSHVPAVCVSAVGFQSGFGVPRVAQTRSPTVISTPCVIVALQTTALFSHAQCAS